MFSEQPLSITPQYQGRRIRVESHQVTLPDGLVAQRDVVVHPAAVVVVPFLDAETVVLIRQYRTAAQRVLLEIPAGCIEEGEDASVAANRELQEETGYFATHLTPLAGGFPSPGFCTEWMHFFRADGLVRRPLKGDEDEWISMVPMSMTAALSAIQTGEICDLKTMVGLYQCHMM